jgi:hypothetical protein
VLRGDQIDSTSPVILRPGRNSLPSVVTTTVCMGAGDPRTLGPGTSILRSDPSVRRGPCDREQAGATLVGFSTQVVHVFRSCSCNAETALCVRHGVAPPPVTLECLGFAAYLVRIRSSIVEEFTVHRAFWQDNWVLKWPVRKQLDIARSVVLDAVRPDRVLANVKREIVHGKPKRPRLIQYSPNLATQARFGPEFTALQKAYTVWFQRREVFPGIRVTFASGLNANQLGEWMRDAVASFSRPFFYERDGKNWDATMQREHLALRLAAYAVAGDDFLRFVEKGFEVVGRDQRSAFKYRLLGTVKSGHNDTTLGNSLVNAAIAATAMQALRIRGDILVAGDDLLVVVDGDFDEHALAAVERACGIVPEYRKFANPIDVSFISGVWLAAGSTFIFIPKPGRLLARLFWTVHPPAPKDVAGYRNGIVVGLRGTCGVVPILRTFLEAHYVAGVDAIFRRDKFSPVWAVRADDQVAHGDVLPSFCQRYHLHATEVEEAESFLASCGGFVGLVSHPVLDRVLAVDLAELADRPLAL